MDLEKILEIVKQINGIVAGLNQMGVHVTGTIDLPTILKLLEPK